MAYRQSTYQVQVPRNVPEQASQPAASTLESAQALNESEYRIVFHPGASSATDRTYTASQRTRRTVGRSRISDYGSLDTAARSYGLDEEESEHTEAILEDEEDHELDSLDSHLHEFRADPSIAADEAHLSSNPVLPTHDGLGSFRVDHTAGGEGVQEHIYAFERYNPRRTKRRRESLEIGQLLLDNEGSIEQERILRIEEWRSQQSQALLEEIHKETGRHNRPQLTRRNTMLTEKDDEAVTLGDFTDTATLSSPSERQAEGKESESFWSRITRRVIQDLMGIDDHLLSILFGEALPDEDILSSTSKANQASAPADTQLHTNMESWESRLLNRIARELGLLVHQISDHPGAFSTYMKVQQMPLPYAGLPVIPESKNETTQGEAHPSTLTASAPEFQPTIQPATQPIPITAARSTYSEMEIDDEFEATPRAQNPLHEITKEEWEKDLDINLVLRYLKSRFTSSRSASHASLLAQRTDPTTSTAQDNAARVARVRQHHPLVSSMHQKPEARRSFKAVVPAAQMPILHRRGSSSCASQSTRKSATGRRRDSGSSRHYWDLGGSIGSGSIIASGGGWGEV